MTEPDPPIREIDDLRRQLRSLGYLDAGVDRFVLGPARDTRGPFAIAALASVRIGALAAVLLGPAAAIGVAARVPGLITGPPDAFVVAAYLGVVFGAAAFAVALSANLMVSWIALRRGAASRQRSLAMLAGAAMTIACLAYLTLWWDASTFTARSGGWSTFWTVCALAVAAAVSLLLGHAVTVAVLAVIVARTGTATAGGIPGASRRVMTAAGGLAFCGALLLFNLTVRFDRAAAHAPSLTVVPSGVRVRVIAVDGFDPDVARRLASAGRLPSLSEALDAATAIVTLDDTRDPARLWTTVATGQPAAIHAVHGLETRRIAGLQGTLSHDDSPSSRARALGAATDLIRLTRPGLASGSDRQTRTVWEVASGAGLRTVVVNWWATWPAPADSGVIVTDRAPLRLERGGALDAEIAPVEAYELLRTRWEQLRRETTAHVGRLSAPSDVEAVIHRAAELDALQAAITREVTPPNVDLVCTYFPGLDLVQHALLKTSEGSAVAASAVSSRLAALEDYYVFLDGLLAGVLQPSGSELVTIVTSPGRVASNTSGLALLRGAVANSRVREAAATAVDVTPTILYALGVPISQELKGRPIIELFSADFARRYPVRSVSTYGKPAARPSPRSGRPLDQEMIDRLRSLGYVR